MSAIPETMTACVLDSFGHTSMTTLPVPKPGPDEVLCKIHAIAICGSDPEVYLGHLQHVGWPSTLPFVLGHEWAGEVVALGPNVSNFKVGDRVAGEAHCGCGQCENCMKGDYTICLNYGKKETGHRHYGFIDQGANAQYNAYRTKTLTKIPDTLSYAAATLCDTAGVAMHGCDMADIGPGKTVVIFGPGPIGLCALGIAKEMGGDPVVMVGRGYRLQTAKELGADVCVNFEEGDPVEAIRELTGGKGADIVIECSGAPSAPEKCINSVRKGGTVVLLGFYKDQLKIETPLTKIVNEQIKVVGSKANPNVSAKVIRLLDKGAIGWDKIVTHRMPLEKYADALDIFMNRKDNVVKMVVEPWS